MRARTILSLCCFLVLLLSGAALFAEPAPTASPADQQFLASLTMPAPTAMTKPQPPPNPCGSDFCTSAQQSACYFNCLNTVGCEGYLSCNNTTCTSNCLCIGRCF